MFVVSCPLVPMAPRLARPPFHRDGWVYEEKVDGWRILAYKDGGSVRLLSRNAVDHTRRFPEIAAAVAKLRPDVLVLDGEVAVFDEHLVSRFHLLGDPDTGVLCTPPMFIAFDVLQVGRKDVRALPLVRRRSILKDAIADSEMVLPVISIPMERRRGIQSCAGDWRDSSPRTHSPSTARVRRARG